VSLEFTRLDMSKPCDSHAIVMRKRMREAALPERTWRTLARKRKQGECGVTGRQGFLGQRDEVKAMAAGMIVRASLL
jgi:hypothetical protein